jgi:hypothetical protein
MHPVARVLWFEYNIKLKGPGKHNGFPFMPANKWTHFLLADRFIGFSLGFPFNPAD